MTNTKYTYHKLKLTNWLLTVTLFFSVFTFSGYAGGYPSKQQQPTQTELVISNHYKTGKRTILYQKLECTSCNDFLSLSKNWTAVLFTHDVLGKVKFDSVSSQFYSTKTITHFLRVKTTSTTSDEDDLVNS